jgi:adenine-specific DNA-methyltransferase
MPKEIAKNKKDYSELSKDDLIKIVEKLESRKKYGLIWDEEKVKEQFEKDAVNALPVLKEVKSKEIRKDQKSDIMNAFIEGDNYHALSVLNFTHQGKIDVIYIDPPYNTGAKSWRYNNDYVDKDDSFKHSKWLSFMNNRLRLAYNLLSDDGFFICAIDDNELYTLGLLLDEIFGESNRLGLVTVLHNPKGRNFTKWFSANSEYMLVYSKNASIASFNEVAIDDEVKSSFELTDEEGKKYRLEPFMRSRTETLRENKPAFWYPIYVSKDLNDITLKNKKGYYEVYPIASNGKEATWINLPETFEEKRNKGTFVAKEENGKVLVYRKFYEQQIFKNVWTDQKYQSEFHGTNLLKKILGKNLFEYPKSLYLLIDILKITTKNDSIILDFFAGSGTTGHAVMKLNQEDGGNRKFIICTNNEGNIATEVTYPRLKNVINGYQDAKGIPANLVYFKTAFVKDASNKDDFKIRITKECTEMLCLREGIFDEIKKTDDYRIFQQGNQTLAVYYSLDRKALSDLKKELNKIDGNKVFYCFTLDPLGVDKSDFVGWNNVSLEPIPQKILDVYKQIYEY